MEFKVGDKLRYVGIPVREFTVGKVYEVTKSDADGFWVTADDGREEGLWRTCKSFEHIELQQLQITSEETTLEVGTRLRYKGALSDYELGGEYEIASTATLGGKEKIYYIDNGESEDEWEHDELLEHFDVLDKPQQPRVAKVKLTQEQADAIEWLIKTGWDAEEIINDHYRPWVEESEALNDLSAADLARALFIGYDVEQTAAEKLVEYYQECKEQGQQALTRGERHEHDINAARVQAINTTVSLLGIGVKGINVK